MSNAAVYAGPAGNGGPSVKTVVIVSVVFHLVVLVGIPLLLKLTEHSVSFERPPTFQLVTAPPTLRPVTPRAQPKLSKPEPVRQHEAKKNNGTKPVPKDKSKPENKEDVDELASMLNEVMQPASVASKGDFKYNWYNAEVQAKIERNWNPSKQNTADSVTVTFFINQNGSISKPDIVSSSDHTLDNIARNAVSLAAPFRPLPPEYAGNKVEFNVTLHPTTRN